MSAPESGTLGDRNRVTYDPLMLGGIIIVIIVGLILPVMAIMSGGFAAGILGWALKEEAEANHEGSELIDLNG